MNLGLSGKAWFDPKSGSIAQESYVLRNKLIRTTNGKTIGVFGGHEAVRIPGPTASMRCPR